MDDNDGDDDNNDNNNQEDNNSDVNNSDVNKNDDNNNDDDSDSDSHDPYGSRMASPLGINISRQRNISFSLSVGIHDGLPAGKMGGAVVGKEEEEEEEEGLHYGTKPGRFETSNNTISRELGSSGVSDRVNERSKQSEQCGASEQVSGASERADMRVAQYLHLYLRLF